jgi:hypothetical protein
MARLGLPFAWRHAALQVLLFVVADLLYELVRGVVVGDPGAAFANARGLVDLERDLGIFVEPQLQELALAHRGVIGVANWLYLNVQFTANAAFLAFLYLRRPAAYTRARDAMFAAMGIALVVHLLLPVAPPRLLPGDGFVDTVKSVAHIDQDSGAMSFLVNPYAAVPSMHCCFALLVGLTGARLAGTRRGAAAWMAYPAFVLVLVVITANHFVLDAVAGALTAALGMALAVARSRAVASRAVPAPVTPG